MDQNKYMEYGKKIINDLCNCDKDIVLYGNGSIGNYVYGMLKKYCAAKCYCVTDGVSHEQTFNHLPVFEVSRIPYEKSNCKVLLTLDAKHWSAAYELLKKNGFGDVLPFTVEMQNALLSIYYRELFLNHGVDISAEIIKIKDVKLRNPFILEEKDFKFVFIEMNDLVLGDILNDYSMFSEGPYLYGKVTLEKGDVVLDCGANLGLFSCVAAASDCTSYAFEPTKRLYDNLNFCKEMYGDRIIPCNYALSDSNGNVDFAISEEWDAANTFVTDNATLAPQKGCGNFVKVETVTVDSFVKNYDIKKVDFIKADIEGAERLMLKGAMDTLKRFAPRLSICTYHFKDDPEVLEEIIKSANPAYIVEHKWKKLYAYVKR